MILTTRSSKLSKTNYKLKGSNTMYKFNNSNKAVIFRRVAQGLLTSGDSVGDSRRLLKNESLLKSLKVFLWTLGIAGGCLKPVFPEEFSRNPTGEISSHRGEVVYSAGCLGGWPLFHSDTKYFRVKKAL